MIQTQDTLQAGSTESNTDVAIIAFYHFASIGDYVELRAPLRRFCIQHGLLGTILLAAEGINGTVAGRVTGVESLLARLSTDTRFQGLSHKISWAEKQPFHRMKVKLKKEIVTMGIHGMGPNQIVGKYVAPGDWNDLIGKPEVRLVDTRNRYEFNLGSFSGAEDPQTDSFREFPGWVDANLDPDRDQHVALFCTGGIRCEKATGYLLHKGFKNVYHLEGGILKYLEAVAASESTWQGECFVFDNRVSVDHDLKPGSYRLCPACRMPLSRADMESDQYEKNVSCPACFDRLTPEKRAGLMERARQMALARQRGVKHLGAKIVKASRDRSNFSNSD